MTGNLVKTSYSKDDVIILLKDLSGLIKAMGTEDREKQIQSGVHYSEMLPLEYEPTSEYLKLYKEALKSTAEKTSNYIGILATKLYEIHANNLVIISLARAGIPIGILVKRYIKFAFDVDVPHYSISIIRGKGIDENAMKFIYEKENSHGVEHFQFLDGWTGKGAINNQLIEAVNGLKNKSSIWKDLRPDLAVLADPANICSIRGTCDDYLIPSSCLNSTVSGLVSRTILRNDLIDTESGDFHGAVYFKDLEKSDRSLEFINTITNKFYRICETDDDTYEPNVVGMEIVKTIAKEFDINDINLIKPGVGETTRVLLRRVPWLVLINSKYSKDNDLKPIYRLCEEKGVSYKEFDLGNYKCCGIIKNLSADA